MKTLKITKTIYNTVVIYKFDFNLSSYYPISLLNTSAHLYFIYNSLSQPIGVKIIDSTNSYFIVTPEELKETEISPASPVEFTGNTVDLMVELVNNIFITAGSGSGNASESNQVIGNNLLDSINDTLNFSNWEFVPGNTKEIVFYPSSIPGSDTDNPSGSSENIKFLIYKTGASVILTQTFSYDVLDNVIKIVAG